MCPLSRADLAFEVLTADVPGCVLQVAANVPPDPVDDLCAALHLQLLAAGKGVATNLGVVWPHPHILQISITIDLETLPFR